MSLIPNSYSRLIIQTLLGATFAAMFPDRVGRLVLDGVVDADHYVAPVWEGSLRDTDAVYNSFAKYCHKAEAKCALWRPNDTVTDIDHRLENIFISLKKEPISFVDPETKMPVIITYTDIRLLMFLTLYAPTKTFNVIAQVLDLIDRELYSILSTIFAWPAEYELPAFCGTSTSASHSTGYGSEAQFAIICSDKRYIVSYSHLITSLFPFLLTTPPL
jgi:pimeloyl-ACP methyl ester carboxylesterase